MAHQPLLNPFRHNQYERKQLIDDLRALTSSLNARFAEIELDTSGYEDRFTAVESDVTAIEAAIAVIEADILALESVPVYPAEEYISASLAANQNNYTAAGMTAVQSVRTVLNIDPSTTLKLTGIAGAGMPHGKRLRIRNSGSRSGTAGAILLERLSPASSAGNKLFWGWRRIPFALMPGQSTEFMYDTALGQWVNVEHESFEQLPMSWWSDFISYTPFPWYRVTGGSQNVFENSAGAGATPQDGIGQGYLSTGENAVSTVNYTPGLPLVGHGWGPQLQFSRIHLDDLSTAVQEFGISVGQLNQRLNPITAGSFWDYTRTSSLLWRTVTMVGGVTTANPIAGFTVETDKQIVLGHFACGNGTRVDFFYSRDGAVWEIVSSHTTNVPLLSNLSFCMRIDKTVGTSSRDLSFDYMGFRSDQV